MELAEAMCGKAFDCCTTGEISEDLFAGVEFSGEADCVETLAGLYGTILDAVLVPAVEAGRQSYSATAAGSCLEAIDAASCDAIVAHRTYEPETLSRDCYSVTTPLVATGDTCSADRDCESDFCTGGECADLPGEGDDCEIRCEPNSYCAAGTCESLKASDEECEAYSECASGYCSDDGVCAAPEPACA